MGLAINRVDRLYGSAVDCIETGSGGFACSNGIVYDGLTDHYQSQANCQKVLKYPGSDEWVIKCSYDGTYNDGKGGYNLQAGYDSQRNYRVGAGVGHSFGKNNQFEVNVNGNIDNQGNYGAQAGIGWKR